MSNINPGRSYMQNKQKSAKNIQKRCKKRSKSDAKTIQKQPCRKDCFRIVFPVYCLFRSKIRSFNKSKL